MKRFLMYAATGGLVLGAGWGTSVADQHEAAEAPDPAVPVELYACKYNEGKGSADMDMATANWNAWADGRGLDDYSAWTLTPFYYGPSQEFDIIWLGVSPNAKAMGAAQDDWIATGGAIQAQFDAVANCDAHGNFAALNYKQPPERDNPESVVLTFSDCNIADGKTFGDLDPALRAWADYRAGHGSEAGMWVLFPAYGGGGEEFDFKWVTGYQNLASNGADWDQYSESGWQKAEELFTGLLECDSSRVYIAQNRRMAADDED